MSEAPISLEGDRIALEDGALVRQTPCGDRVWRLDAEKDDPFVAVHLEVDRLIANSWTGWLLAVDPATGAVLDRRLVKYRATSPAPRTRDRP